MPCYHPLRAYKTPHGQILLGKDAADTHQLRLPCGGCLGCRLARAKEWTLRCTLELQRHPAAVFTTLTYNDKSLPPTLERKALQLWLKRLRKALGPKKPIRFFASGEYGETNNRPHYHAILYGIPLCHSGTIEDAWQKRGFTKTVNLTPAAIAYVAGYNSKKLGWKKYIQEERVDPDTGECYHWQPPFQEMSRRPGIGGHARQWPDSWRDSAILNGYPIPVPRYLHESWKEQATATELETLELEKIKKAILTDTSTPRLEAAEQIAAGQQAIRANKRHL